MLSMRNGNIAGALLPQPTMLREYFIRKKQQKWPNPEESVGPYCGQKLGRLCWRAKGPALAAFMKITPQILEQLKSYDDVVEGSDWVTFTIYMIGKSPSTAKPIIMFACPKKAPRKMAMERIREGNIVELPIDLGHWDFPPDIQFPQQLGVTSEGNLATVPQDATSTPNIAAMQVYVQRHTDRSTSVQKATLGAIIQNDTRSFYLTVNHPFSGDCQAAFEPSGEEDYDPECDFGDESSDTQDELDEHFVESTSIASRTPSNTPSQFSTISSSDASIQSVPGGLSLNTEPPKSEKNTTDGKIEVKLSMHRMAPLTFSAQDVQLFSKDFDYALIETVHRRSFVTSVYGSPVSCSEEGMLVISPDLTAAIPYQDVDVVAVTSSASPQKGVLSGTPSYTRLPGSQTFREVYTVQLAGPLNPGDCGSCVLDRETGRFYGHIIAGSPISCVGYITPAVHVFLDAGLLLPPHGVILETRRNDVEDTSYGHVDENELHCDTQRSQCDNTVNEMSRAVVDSRNNPVVSNVKETQHVSPGNCPDSEEIGCSSAAREHQFDTSPSTGSHSTSMKDRDLTSEFRKILSIERLKKLSKYVQRSKPPSESISTPLPSYISIRNTPQIPTPLTNASEMRFQGLLRKLSELPMQWENPGLLDEALQAIPLERIYVEAEEDRQIYAAEAESVWSNPKILPTWGYEDCVLRALLRWFRTSFFSWVNNPLCSLCVSPTIAIGMAVPNDEEIARAASSVELFQCSFTECRAYERFPRYSDPFVLMQTRRGRAGEWANCFGMLCRAAGFRTRWIWTPEDQCWIEYFSTYQQRWVHVDPCENSIDQPLIYTQNWNHGHSYCIAFSRDGATDVTRRYVRNFSKYGVPRLRVREPALLWIIGEIRSLRRSSLSKEEMSQLLREDRMEETELCRMVAESLALELCKSAQNSCECKSAQNSCECKSAQNSRESKGREHASSRSGIILGTRNAME